MAKSNYLPRILLAGTLCICGYAGSDYLVVGCQLPVVSKNVVQKKLDSPNGKKDQVAGESTKREAEFSKQTAKSPAQKRYQVSGIRYQQEVFLGAKSAFPTTNNQQLTTRFQQLAAKKIYDSQIGIREQGINTGPQVEEYLRYVNLKKGQPWCAAFICWVYGQTGIENPRSGWSPDLFKCSKVIWTKAESRKLKAKSREKYQVTGNRYQDEIFLEAMSVRPTTNNRQPTTGDIFGIFFPEKNRIAHAGFIDQWGDTWLITVEGNTNQSGSREGDGVYRKQRLVKSIYRVARYITESKPIQKTGYE